MKKIFPKIALLISCLAICDSCSKTNSNNNSTVSTSPTESSLSETNKDMTSYFEFIDVGGYGYSVKLKSFPDDGIVIIPKNYSRKDVISIEDHCFSDFTDLKKVVIPDSVISIGDSAFKGCSSLTSITIPNNVTSIGWNAFEGCSSLSSIIIPNGVTRIEYSVFKDCSSLTSITIPNSVTSIDDDAFYGCSSLTSITIPASVKSIGSWAFNRCSSLTSITIPNSVTSIDDDAFLGCSSLKYNEYGNCLYLGNEENLYLVLVEAKDKIIKEATISNNTRFILSDAFRGCSSLTSITIPSSVTSIGSGAFNRCSSLSLIKIPKSVTSIGSYAFYYCDNLIIYCEANSQPYNWDSDWNYSDRPVYWETNMVKDGIKYLIENGNAMATGCINELSNNVIIPATITIGGTTYNVTSVGDNAFSSCKSLVSVTIPNSITSIGNDAFSGCRSLENVYYNGTIENWCKINLSSYYTNPMYNAKHFYMLNTNNEYEELTSIVIPNH